ncbi:ATP synthase F1 subunit gamma [Pseudoflavonifractor sp. 60]|uniref:ATP synthase F1 subunit gamma n=1 Tax=Pseudoflavonifractor sp. 60 TaxID=2304576 RepID=UPI0013685F7B|nr:ATP synthase F1 subunit gamma [Pseudoflavonifractor sp. 60]NBI66529.1 ATP synthase F1 subunit gamma [Pseudoflavonifractor sp. 60]
MAGTKEIKSHIDSVQETRKITNAMYLIASTKLRRARLELEHTRPYFKSLRQEIKRIFRTVSDVESPYFYPVGDDSPMEGTYGCLVITADKGLAGAYNQNAIRAAQELLEEHPDTKLFVVGEYGRRFFASHNIPIEQSFLYTAQNPTMARAREISGVLLDGFDRGELKEIYIVYTDMAKAATFLTRTARVLPFHRSYFLTAPGELPVTEPFEFLPDVPTVLNNMIPSYVSGFIYSALIDSFCCEQNARMMAMDSANQNGEKLLGELSLQYNRVRQSAITQEITEVSAGARAQRQKRGKER